MHCINRIELNHTWSLKKYILHLYNEKVPGAFSGWQLELLRGRTDPSHSHWSMALFCFIVLVLSHLNNGIWFRCYYTVTYSRTTLLNIDYTSYPHQ